MLLLRNKYINSLQTDSCREDAWCPIDKNEGVVKREVFLGGARAPLEETPGAPHIREFRMCGIKCRSSYLHSHAFQKQK
jgi:hypothetical protein